MDRVEILRRSVGPGTGYDPPRVLGACHGGQLDAAQYLFARVADLNWLPQWEDVTPFDAATRSQAADLVRWLREHGAQPAAELNP